MQAALPVPVPVPGAVSARWPAPLWRLTCVVPAAGLGRTQRQTQPVSVPCRPAHTHTHQ